MSEKNISKNKLLVELINNQLDTEDELKLDNKSLNRISRNIDKSIFGDECVFWKGYITYIASTDINYINFFYKGNKYALHRILYKNFIGELDKSEYIKYTCNNKGKCCNINHFKKIKKHIEINNNDNNDTNIIKKKKNTNNLSKSLDEIDSNEKLFIVF